MSDAQDHAAPAAGTVSLVQSILGAPLWLKVIGANVIIVVAAIIAVRITIRHGGGERMLIGAFFGALSLSVAIDIGLMLIALRPLRALEHTAEELCRGNTSARVPYSMLADRDMARVGHALNILVDRLVDDHTRTRDLAAAVISQAESDRARVAHELHESAAQRLAAQMMQISSIARDTTDARARIELEKVREMTAGTLEQVRALAITMNARASGDARHHATGEVEMSESSDPHAAAERG
jgi:two-component system sensor histidine kinase UhpB